MHEQSKIPTVRNLDGVYYRVVRDGNHVSRCFSDLSESEQDMFYAFLHILQSAQRLR